MVTLILVALSDLTFEDLVDDSCSHFRPQNAFSFCSQLAHNGVNLVLEPLVDALAVSVLERRVASDVRLDGQSVNFAVFEGCVAALTI